MIRKIASLPFRVLKRAMDLMDGERSAPFPGATQPASPAPAPASSPAAAAPASPKPSKPPVENAPIESDISVISEVTPNPNAMKFTLNQTVCETGSFSFSVGDDAIAHPIAAAILLLDDVTSVFGVNDFVTVSKTADATWDDLLPRVVSAIKQAG